MKMHEILICPRCRHDKYKLLYNKPICLQCGGEMVEKDEPKKLGMGYHPQASMWGVNKFLDRNKDKKLGLKPDAVFIDEDVDEDD
jgi:hypothetical protein